ncbi:MAG: metal-dependent transcriptional regulator [Lachnospiraceae bacterium]|nr:metal-dependent transcriptional regulator [Lachnospiraceae bacterium]
MDNVSIGKSGEDYLEAILLQIRKNGACRTTDVAAAMGFSKPSASIAIKKLEDEGYIVRDEWKVCLTEEGARIAEATIEKHTFFRKFLLKAGIDEKTADDEACLMEHAISETSFEKLKEHYKEF